MGEKYAYYAFISYSRKDEKWAKWLQRKLESYRLPSAIRNDAGGNIPKHIRPIFRDKTDIIAGGGIMENLRQELRDSRYLIVVCSPDAAQSAYVNNEVRHFQEMGRGDKIIPFIVKGTPNPKKTVEEQCYPPALAESEDAIIGASLEELSPVEALVKIVARILSLKFDALWQRHKRRERLRRLQYILAVCLLLAVGYFWFDYNHIVHFTYYTDYVERLGVPEGIGELKSATVARRQQHYRFEHQSGRLQRVVSANSAGEPMYFKNQAFIDSKDRPVVQVFYYGEGADLPTSVDYLASNGKVLMQLKYSGGDASVIDFVNTGDKYASSKSLMSSMVSGKGGILGLEEGVNSNMETKCEIVRFLLTRDEQNRVAVVRFARDTLNNEAKNADGIFGFEYVYTPSNQVAALLFLDFDGTRSQTKLAVAGNRFEYDNKGNCIRSTYINNKDEPWLGPDHFASIVREYDAYGNVVEIRFFDSDGRPCLTEDGIAGASGEYDFNGHMVKHSYFGVDGKPCLNKEGIAGWRDEFDARGNVIKRVFLGVDGQPCLNKEGIAGWRDEFDARGNMIKRVFLGVDGQPCLNKEGITGWRDEFDARGNMIKRVFLGVDGQPCLAGDGYAGWLAEYDARGNMIKWSFFDTNGQPCLNQEGIAGQRDEFDLWGNIIKRAFFGVDGEPCLRKDGIAGWQDEYDLRGNLIKHSYFNLDGQPCMVKGDWAGWSAEYDSRGNQIKRAFFGVDGKPCNVDDGFAQWTATYDRYGHRLYEAYLDPDGQPRPCKLRFSSVKFEYDARGNMIKQSVFGVDGKPILRFEGYADWRAEYDARGIMIRQSFFGVDGRPCLVSEGYSSWRAEYDARGNMIKISFFGVDGKPSLNKEGIAGWIDEFDLRGNNIKRVFIGADGQPCNMNEMYAQWTSIYDKYGNSLEVAYFDLDGKPTLNEKGFSFEKFEYDHRGNPVKASFFGVNGEPCLNMEGIAGWHAEYDARGNNIKRTFLGIDGQPSLNKDGIAGFVARYDNHGKSHIKFNLDLVGNKKIVVAIPFIKKVMPQGPAGQAGIIPNDVLFEYCDWHWIDDPQLKHFRNKINQCIDVKKRLTIMRENVGFISFDLPSGIVGLGFDAIDIQFEKEQQLRSAYQEHLLKEIMLLSPPRSYKLPVPIWP